MKKWIFIVSALILTGVLTMSAAERKENIKRSVFTAKKESSTKLYGFFSKDAGFGIDAQYNYATPLIYHQVYPDEPFTEESYHYYYAYVRQKDENGGDKFGLVCEYQQVNTARIITNVQIEEVLAPKYDAIVLDHYYACWVKEGIYWRLLYNFEPVTEAKYLSFTHFDEHGYAVVQKNPESFGICYVNVHGQETELAISSSGASSRVTDDYVWKRGEWGYYACSNPSRSIITHHEYADFIPFYSGVAGVKRNGLWGLINSQGDEIVPCQYVRLDRVPTNTYHYVGNDEDGVFHYLTAQGAEVQTSPAYVRVIPETQSSPTQNVANFSKRTIQFGLLDEQSNPLTECKYDAIDSLNSVGQRRARVGNNMGVLSQQGQEIVPMRFRYIQPLQDNRYYVVQNWDDRISIYNTQGECLMQNQAFDEMGEIHNGILYVMRDMNGKKEYRYLTVTGQQVGDAVYKKLVVPKFGKPGYTIATEDSISRLMYDGQQVWPGFEYDILNVYENGVIYHIIGANRWGVRSLDGADIIPLQNFKYLEAQRQTTGWTYVADPADKNGYHQLYDGSGHLLGEVQYAYIVNNNLPRTKECYDDCVPVKYKVEGKYLEAMLNLRTCEFIPKGDLADFELPQWAGNRRIILANELALFYPDFPGFKNYECIDANTGASTMYVFASGVGGMSKNSNIFWYHTEKGYHFWHADGYNVLSYFLSIQELDNGNWLVQDYNGRWGMIDKNGQYILSCVYYRMFASEYKDGPVWAQTTSNRMQIITQSGQIVAEMENAVGKWFKNYAAKWKIVDEKKYITIINQLGEPITGYDWLYSEWRNEDNPITLFALQNDLYSCTMDEKGKVVHYGTSDADWKRTVMNYINDLQDTTVIPDIYWQNNHTATGIATLSHDSCRIKNTYCHMLWHYVLQKYDRGFVDYFPRWYNYQFGDMSLPIQGFTSDKHDTKYIVHTEDNPLFERALPMTPVPSDIMGVERFLNRNKVGKHLVEEWFERDPVTGHFNMHTIQRYGSVNANELLSRTYLAVHEIFNSDKRQLILSKEALDGDDWPSSQFINSKITITTYLFQLDWNADVASTFFNQLWIDDSTPLDSIAIRKERFEYKSDLFTLSYVGQYTSNSPQLTGTYKTKRSVMVQKMVRTTDQNMNELRRMYPSTRDLYTIKEVRDSGIVVSWFSVREGLTMEKQYEILERVVSDNGEVELQRVGIATPTYVRTFHGNNPSVLRVQNATKPITTRMMLREIDSTPVTKPKSLLEQVTGGLIQTGVIQ